MPATQNDTKIDLKEKRHKDVDSADYSDILHQFKKCRKFLDQLIRNAFSRKNLLYKDSKINFEQVHHYISGKLILNFFLVTGNL
jgi:hypothetical protein